MQTASSQSSQVSNLLLLAADNSPQLLPLLRSDPSLASKQDEHGYSLLHAAASYNNIDLARCLKAEFQIDPNTVDEDGETALFVVETVEAAQCLLEDVGTDPHVRNLEGLTAEEKIKGDGDFVVVADFLQEVRKRQGADGSEFKNDDANVGNANAPECPPPLPPGVELRVGTLEDEQSLGEVTDPELKQRIEELASREDFQGKEAQQQLRQLITDAVRGSVGDGREVKPRIE